MLAGPLCMQAFWDWTWDQLADYDLPAVLEFVYNRTGGMKVHYVGHSLVIMLNFMHIELGLGTVWIGEEDAETFALCFLFFFLFLVFLGDLDYSCGLLGEQVNRHCAISRVALPNRLSQQHGIEAHPACHSHLPRRSK
jgi:hypothetical protein